MRKPLMLPLFVALLIISGCTSVENAVVDHGADTSWLIQNLEKHGVAIEGQGVAQLDLRATSSTRMVLNRVDVVDVYEFESGDLAQENAQILQGSDARRDIYQLEALVVVHHGRPGSGVKPVLNELLGHTL